MEINNLVLQWVKIGFDSHDAILPITFNTIFAWNPAGFFIDSTGVGTNCTISNFSSWGSGAVAGYNGGSVIAIGT